MKAQQAEPTKQQRYEARMKDRGFTSTEVLAHADDKKSVRDFARMLREKRGYKGQKNNG